MGARIAKRRVKVLLVLLGALGVFVIVTLPFAARWYKAQALSTAIRHPPAWTPAATLESIEPGRDVGSLTALAFRAWSWMGHDNLGRSLFFRVMPATLISLAVGLGSAVIASVIGSVYGGLAGLVGGRVDMALMRVVDVLYGLPYVLMVILLRTALQRPVTVVLGENAELASLVLMFLAIGGVSWLTTARIVRGQVLTLRHRAFVESARLLGAGPVYVLRRHLLPNVVGPILACAVLVVPQAILQESFLSFLGIGVQPPLPSLGRLAADGVEAVNSFVSFWWLLVFPCGVLVGILLLLVALGENVRRVLDPRAGVGPAS